MKKERGKLEEKTVNTNRSDIFDEVEDSKIKTASSKKGGIKAQRMKVGDKLFDFLTSEGCDTLPEKMKVLSQTYGRINKAKKGNTQFKKSQ